MPRAKRLSVLALGMALAALAGAKAQHTMDAQLVADILGSDDLSITRNVEQANALLDIYEQGKGKEDIARDGDGRETDIPALPAVVRVAAWVDGKFTKEVR